MINDYDIRFWRKVDGGKIPHGCWIYKGCKGHGGYGLFRAQGRLVRAHRYCWVYFNGEIPPGKEVLHRCDNPTCVNPAHLFLGTHRDAIRKRNDKQHTVRGEQHGRSKLTEIEVQEIRTLTLDLTAEKTAEVFNVSRSTISQVRRRETWRHIP